MTLDLSFNQLQKFVIKGPGKRIPRNWAKGVKVDQGAVFRSGPQELPALLSSGASLAAGRG